MRRAEEAQGRVIISFDRGAYIGYLTSPMQDHGFLGDLILPGLGWG